MTSNEYIALLNQDNQDKHIEGLFGKIMRGYCPEHFNALSGDDPNRKLIFLMNSQGLSDIIGKTGYEILRYVGYDEKYICGLVQKNCQFKLAVFSQSEEIKSANWENIIELACQVYPKVSDKLRDNLDALRTTFFQKIERQSEFKFADIDKEKNNHPLYMTYERFINEEGTLLNTRLFLYFIVYCRELYRGDGYTYNNGGVRGTPEFIFLSRPLKKINAHKIIDMEIQLP